MQMPLSFALPKTDWKPPSLHEMPDWSLAKRVSIDVETKDPDLKRLGPGVRRQGNYVCGVGISIEDGPDYYLSIRHEQGDNCDWDVWGYLREQVKNFHGTIVGNGIGYDLDWFAENGCDILDKSIMDVQVADPLINELEFNYNLDALCERYGLPGKDETDLRMAASAYKLDPKKELYRLPARYVAKYGMVDSRRPLQILRRQEAKIREEGVEQIWALEQKVTPILIKMRRRGARIDLEKLRQIEERADEVVLEEWAKIKHATGVQLDLGDVWRAEALARPLRTMGFKIPLTEKTKKASIDKDFLKKCGEIGKWMMRARAWARLKNTNCNEVREALIGDHVHVTFNQLRANDDDDDGRGVRYGRFSSTDYNVQAQPVRDDEFGNLWRSVYIAEEDEEWVCSDWSQQEPRIGVHYAEQLGLPGAKQFADEYRANPDLDIHQKLTDLSGKFPRKIVKNWVNGKLYGMGNVKMCGHLELPTTRKLIRGEMRVVAGPEAQAIIDEFDKFAPWIPGLVREAAKAAEKRGYVWTILRRKCHFQRGPDGKIWKAHKAFNRIGQGSAADQMKATLVAADREGIPVRFSVHDEFDFSQPKGDRRMCKRLRELQMTVVKFSVPMKVDVEVGPSWGEGVKLTPEELN